MISRTFIIKDLQKPVKDAPVQGGAVFNRAFWMPAVSILIAKMGFDPTKDKSDMSDKKARIILKPWKMFPKKASFSEINITTYDID